MPQALSTTELSPSLAGEGGAQYSRNSTNDQTCRDKLEDEAAIYLTVSGGTDFLPEKYNMSLCQKNVHSCTVVEETNQCCPCVVVNSNLKCELDPKATIRNSDLAVCYCIQRVNQNTEVYGVNQALLKLNSGENAVVCKAWLAQEGLGTFFSVATSLVVAVVNIFLGHIITEVATYARHNSISAMNSEIFVVMMLAQLFNSIVLNIIVHAVPIGEHVDFSRSWFSSPGTAMVSTMAVLSFSSHLYPLRQYRKFIK